MSRGGVGAARQAVQDRTVEGPGRGGGGRGPGRTDVGHVGRVRAGVGTGEAGAPVLLAAGQARARRPAAAAVGRGFPGRSGGGGSCQGPCGAGEGEARRHGRRGVGGSLGSGLTPAGAALLGPGRSTRRRRTRAAARGGPRRRASASALEVRQAQHGGRHPRRGHVHGRGCSARAVHEGARPARLVGPRRGAVVGGHGQALVHRPGELSASEPSPFSVKVQCTERKIITKTNNVQARDCHTNEDPESNVSKKFFKDIYVLNPSLSKRLVLLEETPN